MPEDCVGCEHFALPCHHSLEAYLHAYLDGTGLTSDPQGPLFRTVGRGTEQLTRTPLPQANAYAMIQRRAGLARFDVIETGRAAIRAPSPPFISELPTGEPLLRAGRQFGPSCSGDSGRYS